MGTRIAIVGLGVVGRALMELAIDKGLEVYGIDIDPSRTVHRLEDVKKPVEFLHVAFPYSSSFVENVIDYVEKLSPKAVVVHSTVLPGTTRRIFERTRTVTASTPVRGMHHKMRRHLEFWTKWVAVLPIESKAVVLRHLEEMGFRTKLVDEPESLELAKLWETVYRAIMIASWQELHRMAIRFGADIKVVAEFVAEVHEVLKDRPVYYPDVIGGKCLIPNTKLLNSLYRSKLLEFVLESNSVREREIQDPRIKKDVDSLRSIFMRLTNFEYYTDP